MNTQPINIMIMAGGTGGHVFPALSVAEELRKQNVHVEWLGTARGIENTLVPAANIELHHINIEGVRGRGVLGLLKAPFLILLAVLQAIRIFKQAKPDVVIGFGGFASGPGGLAAKILRKPLVIHEQNSVAGTTNRLLAKIANRVLVAFKGAFENATAVGNPVRSVIANLAAPTERYDQRVQQKEPLHLLILGGSLGAKAINELLPEALALLPENVRPHVWHQTGKNHAESTIALYMQNRVNAKVDAFVNDMAAAYAWADIVVCRAGALTVSELMAAGVASVLIPLPSAIDDHQTHNANILVNANAGMAIAQRELTSEKLATLLLVEFSDRQYLKTLAVNARALAMPQAAQSVASIALEMVRG